MAMLNEPIATFRKSELRKPEVVATALDGPVEIVVDVNASLLLVPSELIDRIERSHEQIRRLTQTYMAMVASLANDDVSPLVLGDVGYIAGWPADQRAAFAIGFGEALSESLRTNDPAAALGYVKIMAARRTSIERPSAPWLADEHEELLPERVRRADQAPA
jgi:hypothetical protein